MAKSEIRNLVLYNPASFGGCYNYALALNKAYDENHIDYQVTLLLPVNAAKGIKKGKYLLCNDSPKGSLIYRKLHFLWRNLLNPLRLLMFLSSTEKSIVIFNDFEQTFAPVWVPLFKLMAAKHRYAAILHDPDRDAYPPSAAYSSFCMKQIMSLCHIGFYHEVLPDKPYYKPNGITNFVEIPHGIYEQEGVNYHLLNQLAELKAKDKQLLVLAGNIRKEKNPEMLIKALAENEKLHLVVAGQASSSAVDINDYKNLAKSLGLENRITWIIGYLSTEDFSTVIASADIISLYYSTSFKSQSGVLNTIAPFKKKVIISRGESSLSATAEKFGFGILAEPDNEHALKEALNKACLVSEKEYISNWDNYLNYASWDTNVRQCIEAFRSLN